MSLQKIINQNKKNVYNKKQHNTSTDSINDLYIPTVNHIDRGFDYRDFEEDIEKHQESKSYDLYTGYLKENGLINKQKIKYIVNYVNIDSSTRIRENFYNVTKYPNVKQISFTQSLTNQNKTTVIILVDNVYNLGVNEKFIIKGVIGNTYNLRINIQPQIYYDNVPEIDYRVSVPLIDASINIFCYLSPLDERNLFDKYVIDTNFDWNSYFAYVAPNKVWIFNDKYEFPPYNNTLPPSITNFPVYYSLYPPYNLYPSYSNPPQGFPTNLDDLLNNSIFKDGYKMPFSQIIRQISPNVYLNSNNSIFTKFSQFYDIKDIFTEQSPSTLLFYNFYRQQSQIAPGLPTLIKFTSSITIRDVVDTPSPIPSTFLIMYDKKRSKIIIRLNYNIIINFEPYDEYIQGYSKIYITLIEKNFSCDLDKKYMRIMNTSYITNNSPENYVLIKNFKGDILNIVSIYIGTTKLYLEIIENVLIVFNNSIANGQSYGNIYYSLTSISPYYDEHTNEINWGINPPPSAAHLNNNLIYRGDNSYFYYQYHNIWNIPELCIENTYFPLVSCFAWNNYNMNNIITYISLIARLLKGIIVSIDDKIQTSKYGNISINNINGLNKICNINPNYFEIELPLNYEDSQPTLYRSGTGDDQPRTVNVTYTIQYYTREQNDVTFEFQHCNNIPLSLLNNDDDNKYHIVNNIDNNNIIFDIPYYPYLLPVSNIFNDDNLITLGIIDNIIVGNDNSQNYTLSIGDTYEKIVKIRMINSCFPTSYNIFNLTNNKFYWQNINQNSINSFSLYYPNNCTFDELKNIFSTNSKLQNPVNELIISRLNNEIQIQSLITYKFISSFITFLPNIVPVNLELNTLNNTNETGTLSYILTIQHINHPFNNDDTIQIKNSSNYLFLSSIDINNTYKIIYIDSNKYSIVIAFTTKLSIITNTIQNPDAQIIYTSPFCVYLDKSDTMGNILGFRNVGNPNSITIYDTLITPNTLYINEVKKPNDFSKKIKLNPPKYLIMYCDEVDDNIYNIDNTISKLNAANYFFYKINMNNPHNQEFIYDTFVDTPIIYNSPLRKISKFSFSFFTPDNKPYDFDNEDHSFVLEIVTIREIPINTEL